jgi:hypothetical protein
MRLIAGSSLASWGFNVKPASDGTEITEQPSKLHVSVTTVLSGLVDLVAGLRGQAELHRQAAAERDQEADKIDRAIAALDEGLT